MIERDGNQVRVSGALTIANAAVLCEEAKRHFSGDIVVAAQRNSARISFRNLPESLRSLAALYGVTNLIAGDFREAAK